MRVGFIHASDAITSAMIVTEITPLIDAAMMISTSSAGTVNRVSTAMRMIASTTPPTEAADQAQDRADDQPDAAGQKAHFQRQRQPGHQHRQQVTALIVRCPGVGQRPAAGWG